MSQSKRAREEDSIVVLQVNDCSYQPGHPLWSRLHLAQGYWTGLIQQWEQQTLCDVEVIAEGRRFPVHRCVLAARSRPTLTALLCQWALALTCRLRHDSGRHPKAHD